MPTSPARDASLKSNAKCITHIKIDNKESVRFAIETSKYQNNLYKKLEKGDSQKRKLFEKKIAERNKVITSNTIELKKKEEK